MKQYFSQINNIEYNPSAMPGELSYRHYDAL